MKNAYQRLGLLLISVFSTLTVFAQQQTIENNGICQDPISGTGVTVNGARSAAVSNGSFATDADLSNFATLGGTLINLLGSSISLKDAAQYYPGGNEVGFVIEPVGGLLTTSLLSAGLRITTYRNGTQVEQSTSSGGTVLSASILGGSGGKQVVRFQTTQAFDEVRLEVLQALGLITTVRVYYAFEGPGTCPKDCAQPLITNVTSATGDASSGGIGVCLVSAGNQANLIDADLTNFATLGITGVSIGGTCGVFAQVISNTTIPASSGSPKDVGFLIGTGAGLLDVSLLSSLRIETFLGGTLVQSVSGPSLVQASLLGGTEATQIGFKATQPFDRIRVTIASTVAIGANTRVYYAFIRTDSDGDGVPDCLDKCAGADGTLDTDSDGIPDACDQNIADVSVSVTAGPATTAAVGSTVSFTITATKTGTTNDLYASPTGVVISNTLTTGLTSLTFTAPAGTIYNPATGSWTIGSALSGTAVQALSLVITARADSVGVLSTLAQLTQIDQSNSSLNTGGSACVSVPISGCEGDPFLLTVPDGFTNIQWFRDGVVIAGVTSQTYVASISGSYTFTALAGSVPAGTLNCGAGNCCPVILNLTPAPTVSLGPNLTICAGTPATLTASSTLTSGLTYRWSTGETTASISVTPVITSTYTVTALTGGQCFAVDTVVVNVKAGPTTAGGVARCGSDGFYSITLNPSGGGGSTYSVTLNGQAVAGTFTYGAETASLGNFAVAAGSSVTVVITDTTTGCTLQAIVAGPAVGACSCSPASAKCLPVLVTRVR